MSVGVANDAVRVPFAVRRYAPSQLKRPLDAELVKQVDGWVVERAQRRA
jgi:hypothetical protein